MKKNQTKEIKKIISSAAFGIKTSKGIRPSINKNSFKKGFKKPLSNKLLIKHLNYENTIYYYGNEKNGYTLVMIDIDVNKKEKKGTKKGAIEFAKHINSNIFNIYFEESTNGEGIHGYFILDKNGYSPQKINQILKYFQNYLQEESKKTNSDIELVEIKGTLFEVKYNNKKISEVKYGMLGKIPRNINKLFESKINVNAKKIEESFNISKTLKRKNGSISEKKFNKEELNNIKHYEEIGESILKDKKVKAGKFNVIKEDYGIAIMILKFLKENKNLDNTVPTKRVASLWKALYKANDIKRAWNHHRFAEIRNTLSQLGMIKWIDNRYQIGSKVDKTQGIACKWEISEKMYMYLQKLLKSKQASFVDTSPLGQEIIAFNNNELEEIMYEFAYKIPILSLILRENSDLMHKKAYNYIDAGFCSV